MSSLLLTFSSTVTLSSELAFSIIGTAAREVTNLIASSTTVALVSNSSHRQKVIKLEDDKDFWRGFVDGNGKFDTSKKGNISLRVKKGHDLILQFKTFAENILGSFIGEPKPGVIIKAVVIHVIANIANRRADRTYIQYPARIYQCPSRLSSLLGDFHLVILLLS
jgi:hypothetical protein